MKFPSFLPITCTVLLSLAIANSAQSDSAPEFIQDTVHFTSGDVSIAGVVTAPVGEGSYPAIVLIDGSGATDRNNMQDFSIALAGAGFVTLAYDKRGVGESTGDPEAWRYFSIDDMASDAAAGVELLAARDDVFSDRVGLFGVSQGGWVAPRAAALTDLVSFMVMRSASVTTIGEDRLFERSARLTEEGFSAEEVAEARQMQAIYQEYIRNGVGYDRFEAEWRQNEDKNWFSRVYVGDGFLSPDHPYHQWYAKVVDFDPRPYLEELDIPALWLFGDPAHDRLAPVAASVENLEILHGQGKDYTIVVFPGTNHHIMPVDDSSDFPPYVEPLAQWLEQFKK